MNSRTFSALQKTYDQSHLKSCTAVYYETQGSAPDALQCWKETLSNISSHFASHRLPHGYRPKNEQERSLLESLHDLETRARQRIAAIEDFLHGKPFVPLPNPPPSQKTTAPTPPVLPPRPTLSTDYLVVDRTRPKVTSPGIDHPPPVYSPPIQSPTEERSKRSISYPAFPANLTAPRHAFNPPTTPQSSQTNLKATLRPNRPKKSYFFSSGGSKEDTRPAPATQAATRAWGTMTPGRQLSSSSVPVFPTSTPPPPTTPPENSPRSRKKKMDPPKSTTEIPTRKRQLNPSMGTEVDLPTSTPSAAATAGAIATTILSFFESCRKNKTPPRIEFIPPEFAASSPVLIEGTHMGLTKPALVAAFTAIHPDFTFLIPLLRSSNLSTHEATRLMEATTIAILVDCENLTAVNARKRLVRDFPRMFPPEEELVWITGILTSDLRKHVKGSLLWGYRRWFAEGTDIRCTAEWFEEEMVVVKRAAEVHPTNYYAWNYARWALQKRLHYRGDALFEEFGKITEDMTSWARAHISDTSGWSFLVYIYGLGINLLEQPELETVRARIIDQVKDAMQLGHEYCPGHEALWCFIRTVLTPGFLEGEYGGDSGLSKEVEALRDGLVELLQKWKDEGEPGVKTVGRIHRDPEHRRPALNVLQPHTTTIPDPPNEKSEEESAWDARVKTALANLSKGVDPLAAQQIINEIVVHGDEVHWDDVAGLEGAKTALKEVVVYPFLRPDLFSGLREPARGMLLFGPPGTGKTMLARAVATESKSTFFSISASSLASKWLGDSEKLVRALFAIAKELAPSIIFVDEIDSLLSSRSSTEHEASRRLKTEFLIHWSDLARAAAGKDSNTTGDPSRVLVLAATNLPWDIDEAARRRFVRRQYIPLPEPSTRASQLHKLLAHQPHSLTPAEFEELVALTEGFSGSDITALAKDAAMGPLRSLGEGLLSMRREDIRGLELEDFRRSLGSIRPSVGKEGLRRFEEWAGEFGERV